MFFAVAMSLVVAFVPLPYLELSPGPTYNTIGDIDGVPLIKISGTTTYPTTGHLDLTTVSERGAPDSGVLTMRLLTGWADPDTKVLPREVFYPDDLGDVDIEGENARAFSDFMQVEDLDKNKDTLTPETMKKAGEFSQACAASTLKK